MFFLDHQNFLFLLWISARTVLRWWQLEWHQKEQLSSSKFVHTNIFCKLKSKSAFFIIDQKLYIPSWRSLTLTVAELKYRTILISNSDLADLSKIYWVLENLHKTSFEALHSGHFPYEPGSESLRMKSS